MAFLFGGFFALWAITFVYVFSIGARQKRVQQELERLLQSRADESEVPSAREADRG
jgi:CcmD family protein